MFNCEELKEFEERYLQSPSKNDFSRELYESGYDLEEIEYIFIKLELEKEQN